MILFLDFDGVLHPQFEGQPVPVDVAFCHQSRFETIMRDFPNVEIIISSTWREQFSLDDLRAKFSPDIATRITGTTPRVADALPPRMVMVREWEIVTWLHTHDRQNEPWIAVDDSDWQFQSQRDHLVACKAYLGLDDTAESQLRAALKS